jgi:hypothetical protein
VTAARHQLFDVTVSEQADDGNRPFSVGLGSAHTGYLCVLCGYGNKQRLFNCTALADWLVFVTETECVYCAVRSTSKFCPHSVFMCFVWI